MNYIKQVKLSEIVELITKGTTPTTLGYDFQDEGVNFLKIECFDEKGMYLADKVAHISDECNEKLKRSQLKAGDILFSIAGAIGRVGIVTEEMLPANTNQALAIIRIKSKDIYLPYIKLVLVSPIIKKQFEKKKQGVAQLNLSLKDINELSIPLPDKEKQKVIVDLFDKANILIKYINEELDYLDELIKARFVEMFGDPIINEKDWDVVKLNTVCDGIGDGLHGTPKYDEDGIYPFINGNNLKNGVIEVTSITKMVDEEIYKKHFITLNINAILLSINGTLGKLALYNCEEVMLGKSVCYCNLKSEINREFVYGVMNTESFRSFLESNATVSTIKNVGLKAIRGFNLILPPKELQDKYVDFADEVNKSKVEVKKALDEAQLLFDSLMQKYFG